MSGRSRRLTAPVAAGSLIGGYAVARFTRRRPLGAVVLVAGGAWCTRQWTGEAGPPVAAVLLGVYAAGFVGSHKLARYIGAWPSVLGVAAVSGAASWFLADRRAPAAPPVEWPPLPASE
jgi:hypothetical protein